MREATARVVCYVRCQQRHTSLTPGDGESVTLIEFLSRAPVRRTFRPEVTWHENSSSRMRRCRTPHRYVRISSTPACRPAALIDNSDISLFPNNSAKFHAVCSPSLTTETVYRISHPLQRTLRLCLYFKPLIWHEFY